MIKKMLVAFDGSEKSYDAFNFALELTKLCTGAAPEITVLSVIQPPEISDMVEMDAIIDSAKQHYEELFRKLREQAKEKNLEIITELLIGHPADQIVHYIKEKRCDVVILGQRGRSKIEKWLLGSVSKRVATYAPCTVIIVK